MNDLYTLLQVRDELEKAKKFAKSNARHQWTGLQAASNAVHHLIQSAMDERESMAQEYAGPDA